MQYLKDLEADLGSTVAIYTVTNTANQALAQERLPLMEFLPDSKMTHGLASDALFHKLAVSRLPLFVLVSAGEPCVYDLGIAEIVFMRISNFFRLF
jgi:hypothetical protein